jgi:DNA-binding GntR family transcriptional regulator
MRNAFEGAEEAVERRDARALVRMDQRFHAAIARASRNATLARIIIPLQHKAARFWVFSMSGDIEANHRLDIEEHLALIGHIARHDADAARNAMLGILGVGAEDMRRAVAAPAFTPLLVAKRSHVS